MKTCSVDTNFLLDTNQLVAPDCNTSKLITLNDDQMCAAELLHHVLEPNIALYSRTIIRHV